MAITYKIIESHQDRISTIEVWDNGIIFLKLNNNCQVELADSERQYELLRSKFDGQNKLRVLVEPGQATTLSKESRVFSAVPERNLMTERTAVLTKTLAHRIIINFLINITRQQSMKMRMFDKREKAIEWLLALKDRSA